jgi:hypothetical protein
LIRARRGAAPGGAAWRRAARRGRVGAARRGAGRRGDPSLIIAPGSDKLVVNLLEAQHQRGRQAAPAHLSVRLPPQGATSAA